MKIYFGNAVKIRDELEKFLNTMNKYATIKEEATQYYYLGAYFSEKAQNFLDGKETSSFNVEINEEQSSDEKKKSPISNDMLHQKAMRKISTMKNNTSEIKTISWNNELKGKIE